MKKSGPLGLSEPEYDEIEAIKLEEKLRQEGKLLTEHPPIKEPFSAFQVQVGGTHYKNYQIQPSEFLYANGIDHLRGEIIMRVLRFKDKFKDKEKQLEDLRKAKHEIDMLIELEGYM